MNGQTCKQTERQRVTERIRGRNSCKRERQTRKPGDHVDKEMTTKTMRGRGKEKEEGIEGGGGKGPILVGGGGRRGKTKIEIKMIGIESLEWKDENNERRRTGKRKRSSSRRKR